MKTNIVDDVMGFKSPKKRVRKLSPNIIRVGDTVKIINPEIVIRIGYPMSFKDARKEVKELYHEKIIKFMEEIFPSIKRDGPGFLKGALITSDYSKYKAYDKIIRALAFEHLQSKQFGGKERKIYSEQRQELLGITANVKNILIRKTGIYFSPSGGYDNWTGDYDYESGGLSNEKTHKILELDYWTNRIVAIGESYYVQIEACNVEKIK